MIIVHGSIPIRHDCRDEAVQLARTMAEATREEVGCISYDFYIGLADPNTLMVFQEWESMDALMAHFQTGHMETFLERLPDLVSGEIITKRYAVQSVEEDEEEPPEEAPPIIH